jgi:hypothetical protein
MKGRPVMQQKAVLKKGANAIMLNNIQHLSSAVYFLTVTTDSFKETVKVIRH